jgi:hypothetical protein
LCFGIPYHTMKSLLEHSVCPPLKNISWTTLMTDTSSMLNWQCLKEGYLFVKLTSQIEFQPEFTKTQLGILGIEIHLSSLYISKPSVSFCVNNVILKWHDNIKI